MRTTMLILLICILTQTAGFGELTKQDLEAIQKVVKEEISKSEQRTAIKLAEINTEIKVIKTDIKGVKDRLDDTQGLVIAVIALIAVIVGVASAMTYAAGKLGSAIGEIQKVHASNDETKELMAQNTEAKNEQNRLIEENTAEEKEKNRLLGEYTKRHEEQNALYAGIQAKVEEVLEELRDETSNDTVAHTPAD